MAERTCPCGRFPDPGIKPGGGCWCTEDEGGPVTREIDRIAFNLYAAGPWGEPFAFADGGFRLVTDAHSMDVYRKIVEAVLSDHGSGEGESPL